MVVPSRKDNNGRAGRRFLIRRGTTISLILMLIISIYLMALDFLGSYSSNDTGYRPHPKFDMEQVKQEVNRRRMGPGSLRQVKPGWFDRFTSSRDSDNNRGVVEVNTDDTSSSNQALQVLLSASVHLIDIRQDLRAMADASDDKTYTGIIAEFCELDFTAQRRDPSLVPMFRQLVNSSPGCASGKHYEVDLKAFSYLARIHDVSGQDKEVKALPLQGVVFHESRCGSTLVANALVAMDPPAHRVFSESAPPIAALRTVCGETYQFCSVAQAASLLQDVMYAMSRSNDPLEKRLFFKIQSIGSRNLEVFQEAFPTTPWVFVYRNPVQVMTSHLEQGVSHANCVIRRHPGGGGGDPLVKHFLNERDIDKHSLSDVEYCAAHLATITDSAVKAIERAPMMGRAVNYADLPHVLWEEVFSNHFNMEITDEQLENIKSISGVYSKGTAGRHGTFKDDTEKKERTATQEMRDASERFLDESYQLLLLEYGFETKEHEETIE
mmetsp:Transcript_32825/g.48590  ORF Transcript_32825/g.48590 Transcript_32825/m.48590 type:complete len:495 (+) Transcript_32825:91-1575(+)